MTPSQRRARRPSESIVAHAARDEDRDALPVFAAGDGAPRVLELGDVDRAASPLPRQEDRVRQRAGDGIGDLIADGARGKRRRSASRRRQPTPATASAPSAAARASAWAAVPFDEVRDRIVTRAPTRTFTRIDDVAPVATAIASAASSPSLRSTLIPSGDGGADCARRDRTRRHRGDGDGGNAADEERRVAEVLDDDGVEAGVTENLRVLGRRSTRDRRGRFEARGLPGRAGKWITPMSFACFTGSPLGLSVAWRPGSPEASALCPSWDLRLALDRSRAARVALSCASHRSRPDASTRFHLRVHVDDTGHRDPRRSEEVLRGLVLRAIGVADLEANVQVGERLCSTNLGSGRAPSPWSSRSLPLAPSLVILSTPSFASPATVRVPMVSFGRARGSP